MKVDKYVLDKIVYAQHIKFLFRRSCRRSSLSTPSSFLAFLAGGHARLMNHCSYKSLLVGPYTTTLAYAKNEFVVSKPNFSVVPIDLTTE